MKFTRLRRYYEQYPVAILVPSENSEYLCMRQPSVYYTVHSSPYLDRGTYTNTCTRIAGYVCNWMLKNLSAA
eukprot:COSAG02_NODE_6148_length_3767_cov_2.819248_4_plen_72_part_00